MYKYKLMRGVPPDWKHERGVIAVEQVTVRYILNLVKAAFML